MPLAIAPTGLTGLLHGDGEILAARAAERAGIRFTLSTMSICSIEDVRAAVREPFWFQLYVFKDRGFSEEVVARVQRRRLHRFVRHRRCADARPTPRRHQERPGGAAEADLAQRLRRSDQAELDRRRAGGKAQDVRQYRRLHQRQRQGRGIRLLGQRQFRPVAVVGRHRLGAQVLARQAGIERRSRRRRRASKAADLGVDAIVVSNHGGRQLDGAPATIAALPRIADAAGDRIEILFDGGVRSGQDVSEGAGAWRARLSDRPRLSLWPCRHGRSRRQPSHLA